MTNNDDMDVLRVSFDTDINGVALSEYRVLHKVFGILSYKRHRLAGIFAQAGIFAHRRYSGARSESLFQEIEQNSLVFSSFMLLVCEFKFLYEYIIRKDIDTVVLSRIIFGRNMDNLSIRDLSLRQVRVIVATGPAAYSSETQEIKQIVMNQMSANKEIAELINFHLSIKKENA